MFSIPAIVDLSKTLRVFDDFVHVHDWWTAVNDGTTGTNTLNDAFGGTYSLVTAAADNDYHYIVSDSEVFKPARSKPIRCQAYVKLTEANTDDANIVFGLSNTVDATLIANDAGGLTDANISIAITKLDGGTSWLMAVSTGSAETTETIATFTSATWTKIGFEVRNAALSTELEVVGYVQEDSGSISVSRPIAITASTFATEMHFAIGVKAGGANAETLIVDYVNFEQER